MDDCKGEFVDGSPQADENPLDDVLIAPVGMDNV